MHFLVGLSHLPIWAYHHKMLGHASTILLMFGAYMALPPCTERTFGCDRPQCLEGAHDVPDPFTSRADLNARLQGSLTVEMVQGGTGIYLSGAPMISDTAGAVLECIKCLWQAPPHKTSLSLALAGWMLTFRSQHSMPSYTILAVGLKEQLMSSKIPR